MSPPCLSASCPSGRIAGALLTGAWVGGLGISTYLLWNNVVGRGPVNRKFRLGCQPMAFGGATVALQRAKESMALSYPPLGRAAVLQTNALIHLL